MALQRDTLYAGRFETGNSAHPQGAFKNRTTPTSQDGSYLEAQWLNDWDGFFASLLNKAGLTPNGNVDAVGASQYFTALQSMVSGNYVTAGGTANVITLIDTSVTAYTDGMPLRFKVSLANTGATTLNVNGVGAVTVYGSAGLACQGGELAPGLAIVVYSNALAGFVIVHCTGGNKQVAHGTQSHHAVSYAQYTTTPTESVAGIVRRATDAEEIAGTSDVGFLTPLGLRTALNAVGSAPVFALRAWVSFRQVGTQAINASGNILSITDVAVGRSTFTFSTAMSDIDYAVSGVPSTSGGGTVGIYSTTSATAKPPTKLTSSCQIAAWDYSGTLVDFYDASVMFMR